MITKRNLKSILSFTITFIVLMLFKAPFAFATDTLTQYNIETSFNAETKILTATQTVKFTNTYNQDLNSLVFHLYADSYGSIDTLPAIAKSPRDTKLKLEKDEIGDINITTVSILNKDIKFTQNNQLLKIDLKNNLKPNTSIELKINFTLKPPKSTCRLGYYESVYSFTNWYPIISIYDINTKKWDENPFHPVGESNYSDISNYKFTAKLPDNMVLASTGTTLSTTKNPDGSKTNIFNISAEKVRDFVFVMSPDFKVISKKINDVTVNSFYINNKDNSTKEKAESLLNFATDSIDFFSKSFGKYPYTEFDMVETHIHGFAMEYPQLIQMPKYFNTGSKELTFLEEAAVHEIGHQWWYVTVGSNEFKEPFLDESLTVFSTAYYFEKQFGKYSSKAIAMNMRNRINEYPARTPIGSSVNEFKDSPEYFSVVYGNGGLIFEELRNKVGEEKFLKVIRTYFDRYKLKNSSIKGLLQVIDEICGKDAKDLVSNALNSKSYFPKDLLLTKEEYKLIQREEMKERFNSSYDNNKNVTFNKFILNALNDNNICIVTPSEISKLSEAEKTAFTKTIDSLKEQIEMMLGINVKIKADKDLAESDLSNSDVILFGDPTKNTYYKNLMIKLPFDLEKETINFGNVIVKNKNISGIFIGENPKNKDKCLISIINMDKDINLYEYNDLLPNQFILKSGNKKLIGNYND